VLDGEDWRSHSGEQCRVARRGKKRENFYSSQSHRGRSEVMGRRAVAAPELEQNGAATVSEAKRRRLQLLVGVKGTGVALFMG
jgi:hypothetical protein